MLQLRRTRNPTRCCPATRSRCSSGCCSTSSSRWSARSRRPPSWPGGSAATGSTPARRRYDPEALVAVLTAPPAVHRYPGSMGGRVQALARASSSLRRGRRWALARRLRRRGAVSRLVALPGFGPRRRRSSWPCWASSAVSPRRVARPRAAYGEAGCQVGRRRRRRGVPGEGPRVQAGGQGGEEGGSGRCPTRRGRGAVVSGRRRRCVAAMGGRGEQGRRSGYGGAGPLTGDERSCPDVGGRRGLPRGWRRRRGGRTLS